MYLHSILLLAHCWTGVFAKRKLWCTCCTCSSTPTLRCAPHLQCTGSSNLTALILLGALWQVARCSVARALLLGALWLSALWLSALLLGALLLGADCAWRVQCFGALVLSGICNFSYPCVVQVRLYSLGHLRNLDSAFSEKPVTVQRLPSKLSSLAWDHSQQVHLGNSTVPTKLLAFA